MPNKRSIVAIVTAGMKEAEEVISVLYNNGAEPSRCSVLARNTGYPDKPVVYSAGKDGFACSGNCGFSPSSKIMKMDDRGLAIAPELGIIFIGGEAVRWVVERFEKNSETTAGLSIVGTALYSRGIPKNSVLSYESSVKKGQCIVLARGTMDEADNTCKMLKDTDCLEVNVHKY